MKKKRKNKEERSVKNEERSRVLNLVLRSSYLVLFIGLLLATSSCSKQQDQSARETYTCPMHPTVVSETPGPCPVCGMDLVRKAKPGEEVEITEDLARLLKSPNESIVASAKTVKAEYKSLPVSIQAQGMVTYDTRNIYTVPSRVGGRLEKVYPKYAFQKLTKEQVVADVYSPELITAQRELLFLLDNDAANKTIIDATKNKLELLGLTNAQINTLIQKREASNVFHVYSPYSGYIITEQQAPSTSASMPSTQTANGMGSASSSTSGETNSSSSIIREGSYVSSGQMLFRIVNDEALRIEIDLPVSQSGAIKKGDKLEVDFGNGTKEKASVDFVQPFFSNGQDFIKLRVFTNKTEGLHIGHLVTVTINLSPIESLWVPKESVVYLGKDNVVFIKDHEVLKATRVTIGVTSEGMTQITGGLASSDEIAMNAQYLVDSESFIKAKK